MASSALANWACAGMARVLASNVAMRLHVCFMFDSNQFEKAAYSLCCASVAEIHGFMQL
jgi:hypothetical protein